MKSLPAFAFALVVACLAASFARGGDDPDVASDPSKPTETTDTPSPTVSAEQIETWLKALESDSFSDRQTATNGLTRAGKPAVEGLARTAEKSFDLEVPTRCINILGKLGRSHDEATSTAAKAALESLTKSERKFVANRAAETLKGPEEPAPANPFGGGGVRIVVNGMQIGGAGATSISQSTVNGVRTTDVKADGKKIRVTDTNGRNIAMKVTETVAGNEVTKEYAGDDLADLKKKHPEGAKLYEQYVEGNANPFGAIQQFQIGPNGRIQIAPGGLIPALPVLPNAPAPNVPANGRNAVPRQKADKAVEQLERSLESLDALEKSGKLSKDSVEEVRKQIDAARRLLEPAG